MTKKRHSLTEVNTNTIGNVSSTGDQVDLVALSGPYQLPWTPI